MIAKAASGKRAGGGKFAALKDYVELAKSFDRKTGLVSFERRRDLVAAWSHGVANHETAALEMQLTVAKSKYSGNDPVYHMVASWRPGETTDVGIAKKAERALVRSIGAEDHQTFSALHYDVNTDRFHLHVVLNKVNAQTGKALKLSYDYAKLHRGAEWVEREFNLRVDPKTNWRKKVGERGFEFEVWEMPALPGRSNEAPHEVEGKTELQRGDELVRKPDSWMREAGRVIDKTLKSISATWQEVHASLRSYGLGIESAGMGFRIVRRDARRIDVSRIGLQATALKARLGPFEAAAVALGSVRFDDRIAIARSVQSRWKSWGDAHRELATVGLAIRDLGGNRGQIVDLEGYGRAPVARLGTALGRLEKRLGTYEPSPALIVLDVAESAERASQASAQIRVRADLLSGRPELILDPLSAQQSTWTRYDIERAVRTMFETGKDEVGDKTAVDMTTASILVQCMLIDEELGVYTTRSVIKEERAMFDAAQRLAERIGATRIRTCGSHLDQQQCIAYEYLATDKGLALVIGAADAERSLFLRDLAVAYAEAGFRVIGVAVAGDVARRLGEEVNIASGTTAKLLSDLDMGRKALTSRDVVLIDEASTLGIQQGRRLFECALHAGATVRLLGNETQHELATRGTLLRGLVEAHGALDMALTRRTKNAYLRQLAVDLRAGHVSLVLDALQKHGAIRAYERHAQAKAYLADRYIDAVAQTVIEHGTARPREAILICDTHEDVAELSTMVQQQLIANGKVGEGATYTTNYGNTTFFIGDLLSIDESGCDDARVGNWKNGDSAVVLGHGDDGVLSVRRLRDGVIDTWSTQEHGAIRLGYARTSRRPQGTTVDDVFLLPARGRRGTYVDITRARETLTIAYGEDEISDFGELMLQAHRDGDTALIRDVIDSVADRRRRESMAKEVAAMEVEIAQGQHRLLNMGLAVGGEDRPSARGKPLSLDEHRMTGKVKLEGLRPPANVRPKRADLDSGEGRGI